MSAEGGPAGSPVRRPPSASPAIDALDPPLRTRVRALIEDGRDLWDTFDIEVRQHEFHPFVAGDYERIIDALVRLHSPGMTFLEWGSATGVITIAADLIGYDASGIELDRSLVAQARDLAARHGSGATFVAGSFLPTGYRFRTRCGDTRTGTIGEGESGYLQLGRALDEFDLVFGYPWSGEASLMLDLMRAYGREDALLLIQGGEELELYRRDVRVPFTRSSGTAGPA